MNASASPGRTWIIFGVERQLPDLVAAVATVVLCGGGGNAGLPGMADPAASGTCADPGHEANSGHKRGHQHHFDRRLDCDFDSLRITNTDLG